MAYLGPTLVVFAILIVVAIAAVSFEPANPMQQWMTLSERYATERRPTEIQFADQRLLFGGAKGRLKPLNPYVAFDVTLDDFGLWIVGKGINEDEFAVALKIPGTHVRAAGQHGNNHQFDLYAEPPVRISVPGELGAAIHARGAS